MKFRGLLAWKLEKEINETRISEEEMLYHVADFWTGLASYVIVNLSLHLTGTKFTATGNFEVHTRSVHTVQKGNKSMI